MVQRINYNINLFHPALVEVPLTIVGAAVAETLRPADAAL
jgi:hypothetical protein